MGIKNMVTKAAGKAGNVVAKLAALSPTQVEEIQRQREEYLLRMPRPDDIAAQETTRRMMAASSVEIYNAYLSQLKQLYLPIQKDAEYAGAFDCGRNIRIVNITKWVTDKKENNLEKLVNVYAVLADEDCNIALIFHRTQKKTEVFLAVINTANDTSNTKANEYENRILDAIRGNFPGAEWASVPSGILPHLNNDKAYSVATASNIPAEKSEKFVSQTIEKLLDGIVPTSNKKEYTLILMATPIRDVEERKLKLGEFHSGLAPYASWQTGFTLHENKSLGSTATVGVNVGASAGVQNGVNSSITENASQTDNSSQTLTENESETITEGETITDSLSNTHTDGSSTTTTDTKGSSDSAGGHGGFELFAGATYQHGWNRSTSEAIGQTVSDAVTKGFSRAASETIAKTTGSAVANTLGKAVTKGIGATQGASKALNLGANFGANFARSSTVTAMIGQSESITQTFSNFNIKHALELLEAQMKRLEQSTALGMWDFAAYVMSEDHNTVNNVAHSYMALTLGEDSYMSKSAINVWRGDVESERDAAREICGYLRELRHPSFGLAPALMTIDSAYNVYPSVVTATTSLSGKELAYSLNFPQRAIAGLPILECAAFGRNIATYDSVDPVGESIPVGSFFHMNHVEDGVPVELALQSLASHTFITGSTGSGKSNTVYKIIDEAKEKGVRFLVIEPAKGEYKHIFGMCEDVSVYGTNPELSPMLRINPFSFPKGIHILEHMDRLIEIFNVCWPMYAAMPAVLKAAVEKSYIDCGWNLNTSKNIYGEEIYPSFADVARNVKVVIDSSEYDNDNKGAYKGALQTRLTSLANGLNGMIFVQDEISASQLFDENVIIDLSRVGSAETKSLIMGMLVLKLQEHRMVSAVGMNSALKHLTVLEEAHNLLKKTTGASSEGANIQAKSVEMIANAIAEMRTYGEGFIIADQAPGLMDMSVIRNTNTKIIMRLPDQGDRELVGRAASLDDDQIAELAKLPCGVAAIYQNEWVQAILCKVDKYDGTTGPYTYTISEDDLSRYEGDKAASESLLSYIMNKELFRRKDGSDIHTLKEMIIKSRLDSTVKLDFIQYINADSDNAINRLRSLLYDLTGAAEAIEKSRDCDNIKDWVHSVVDELRPTIRQYSNHQIDLAMALIIYEQSVRDAAYNNILCRFTEVYRDKGGVF